MDVLKAIGLVILVLIIFVAIGTGIAFWGGWLESPMANLHTRAVHQSNQYRISNDSDLSEKMEEWYDLDKQANLYKGQDDVVKGYRAQQAVLLRQMRVKAHSVEQGQVAPDVAAFLSEHSDE